MLKTCLKLKNTIYLKQSFVSPNQFCSLLFLHIKAKSFYFNFSQNELNLDSLEISHYDSKPKNASEFLTEIWKDKKRIIEKNKKISLYQEISLGLFDLKNTIEDSLFNKKQDNNPEPRSLSQPKTSSESCSSNIIFSLDLFREHIPFNGTQIRKQNTPTLSLTRT